MHLHAAADPARRRAVVGRLDFHAAIQMHRALAVLVIAEWLHRQRQQGRPLFGEHGRHLPFGGAVDARVGPALLPVVQIGLRLLQAFEAQSFQRRFLGMADASLHLSLAIRIAHAAGQRHDAVVLEHVAIQRIDGGIVDVGLEHALAQVIEDHNAGHSAQSAKGLLVQFGPDLRTGTEHQQANRLAAVAQRQHKQPCAPVLARCAASRTMGPVP